MTFHYCSHLKCNFLVLIQLAICTWIALFTSAFSESSAKPNVLFIAIDDLRDWVGYLGKNPQTLTPNIDRLAARGTAFTRSYCASPSCNPSRAALMSGMRPSSSGVYSNFDDWREFIPPERTLNWHFRENGYEVLGAGKIYHEEFFRFEDWSGYEDIADKTPSVPIGQSTGVQGIKFAPLDCNDEDLGDWQVVNYAIDQLGKIHDKPLFLACGIHKPHMPWNVPRKYYDMHPPADIVLPPNLAKGVDLADVPPLGIRMAMPKVDHNRIIKSGRWKEAVQGYLASISYADMLVGRLLDALDKSPMKNNTIICLWSDHGWSLGEKEHWRKFALWEETTRTPLIWVVPGITQPGSVCNRTVDLMSIYPTLAELCGIKIPNHVEGVSILPLLITPQAEWNMPALSTYSYNCHAVRTENWCYIRYRDGSEELYDKVVDPNEWKNLANQPSMSELKKTLASSMPVENHLPSQSSILIEASNGTEVINNKSSNFGNVALGKSSKLIFKIKNRGESTIENIVIEISDLRANHFELVDFIPGQSLNLGEEIRFSVRFNPLSEGDKKTKLKITYTGGEKTPYKMKLTGNAYRPIPEITISHPVGRELKDGKSRVSFGNIKDDKKSITKTFKIKNTGSADLEDFQILLDGINAGDFTYEPPLKNRVAPGTSTRFKINFKPTETGNRKATIRIISNDEDESPFDIILIGTKG